MPGDDKKDADSQLTNLKKGESLMSGDNLHGKQPIKFYSEQVTLTKVQLLEKQLNLGDKISDLDEKHKHWSRILFSTIELTKDL